MKDACNDHRSWWTVVRAIVGTRLISLFLFFSLHAIARAPRVVTWTNNVHHKTTAQQQYIPVTLQCISIRATQTGVFETVYEQVHVVLTWVSHLFG